MIAEIEPAELAERQRDPGRDPPVIVDVREPWEFAICRIEGSRSVPLGSLAAGAHQLKLYVPNTGNLVGGSHLRLYARAPNGGLAKGPIIPY